MAPHPAAGILLVEDDRELRGILSSNLEREGFRVFLAGDGGEAVRVLGRHLHEISVVVTDLGIPGFGGIELVEKIKRLRSDLRIICVSGFDSPGVRAAVAAAGADRFVPKPFPLEVILLELSSVLATP
jgi:DNA-binding response OmpR family regulator